MNQFTDNGNGTVTDHASGLMWQQADSGAGLNWQDALAYAEDLELAGYRDWRLPNAKELQGIVDYTRSPPITGTPAIDPVFFTSAIADERGQTNYPFYWTGTTHLNTAAFPGRWAIYICFGEALGYFNGAWQDVHGAGAQRSDPKFDDGTDYSFGHGPQGDAVRILNYVRCVRAGSTAPAQDTDADGLTDWYEWDYSSSLTNMVPTGDDDEDGALNGEECAAGTIPTDPLSYLAITELALTGSNVIVRWSSEPDRTYALEQTAGLSAGAGSTLVASGIPATPPLNVHTNPASASGGIYCIVVE